MGEKAIPGVPCEPPANCSGPVHGEAARCHEMDRVEDSGRSVLLESPNSRRGELQRPSGFWLLHQACLWGSRRLVGKPGAELTVPGFLMVERWDSSCWQRLSVKGRHRSALAKSGLHGPRCWMRAAGRAVTPPIITLGLSCLTGLLLLGHRVLQGVDSSLLII